MTIPNVNPYTGNKPTPGQPQPEFNQNMSDELDYFNSLPEELNPAIDGINEAATQVANNTASAEQSAVAAEAAAQNSGYAGLWPDTGGSALKGETWQTQVSGVPTGDYFVALQDTSVTPVNDNVNWREFITHSSFDEFDGLIYKGDSQIFEGNIWPESPNVSAKAGDSGLTDVSGLRDAVSGVIYRMTRASGGGDVAVSGEITSIDFTAKTAVIGGLSLRLYRKFKQFGCAIRNTGSGWAFIADSGHRPVGFSGISTTPGGAIKLDYDFTASRVVTLSVNVDETYAKQGIIAGASVGATFATIELSADLEFLVDPKSGAITAPSYWGGEITATTAQGSCVVTHPATVTNGVIGVAPVGGTAFYRTDFTTSISPTVTSIIGTGDADGVIGYSGAAWSYSGSMFNDPVMTWDSVNNKLDVTHDECEAFNISVIPRNGGYLTKLRDVSATGFSVEFFDFNGNQASVESILMNFIFTRKGRVRKENLEGVLSIKRGRAPIDASNLTEQFGNLWISGFHEVDE